MTEIIVDELDGIVLAFVNIAAMLPQYKGRIGLDVRIRSGRLHIGQQIKISGPETFAKLKILGVEAKHNQMDPKVVRIHCDLPAGMSFPDGQVEAGLFQQNKNVAAHEITRRLTIRVTRWCMTPGTRSSRERTPAVRRAPFRFTMN